MRCIAWKSWGYFLSCRIDTDSITGLDEWFSVENEGFRQLERTTRGSARNENRVRCHLPSSRLGYKSAAAGKNRPLPSCDTCASQRSTATSPRWKVGKGERRRGGGGGAAPVQLHSDGPRASGRESRWPAPTAHRARVQGPLPIPSSLGPSTHEMPRQESYIGRT